MESDRPPSSGCLVRCVFCGPFPLDDDRGVVDQIHEHAMSESHKSMVRLDRELNALFYLGEK